MKTLVASLALLSFSGFASASTITCAGSYWWVRFQARAITADNKTITSPIAIKVTGVPGGPKSWNLTPTTSLVSPGQAISFSATAPEGGGSMMVTYNGRDYRGHIKAETQYGNFDVDVTCTLGQRFRFR